MLALQELFTAVVVFATVFCVLVGVGALVWKVSTIRREWEFEDVLCECGHDFYDHVHPLDGYAYSPCTKLMCSCQEYTPTPTEETS